ncbi:FkbM family methyltransferase [Nitrososphaera sp.]|uniref:FkbM family methyltransferase n=1 Tax=Nitrososphaera sp. TaxID=1971748 RepID=UPI00182CB6D7|nr:FkbM family methyltransferase [Nitrososphaera sp.]NWG36456.1 FkbM family methyltransferase [Nitrososphaera sp.]
MPILKNILGSLYKRGEHILAGHELEKYRVIHDFNKWLIQRLKSDSVEVNGYRMFVDWRDSLHLSINKSFEPFQTEIAKKMLRQGDVAVDIGANIGYYSLLFAATVGSTGRVFAFEPDPYNFGLLRKNAEINNFSNITMFDKAVSDTNRQGKLYKSEYNLGDHRIFALDDDYKSIDIEVIRLDDVSELRDVKISLIKIDIQGSEGAAVTGMKQLIARQDRLVLMCEFIPSLIKGSGMEPESFLTMLRELGFKLHEIDEKAQKMIPTDVETLLRKYPTKSRLYTNLLCVKGSLQPL